MSDPKNVEERIFHVENECYVIYLGSSPDDVRPFLRIGTSEKLPLSVHREVKTVIITDIFTGDPLVELKLLAHDSFPGVRYVGDPQTLKRFRLFLDAYNVKYPSLVDYHDLSPQSNLSIVTFFDDGNIELSLEGKTIFDLFARQRQDVHYIELTRQLKRALLKIDSRYPISLFNESGFINTTSGVFFFSNGAFAAFKLEEQFYEELSGFGINPDSIEDVFIDEINSGIFELLKRKGYTHQSVSLYTSHVQKAEASAQLFTLPGEEDPIFNIQMLREEQQLKSEFIVQKKEKGFCIQHPKFSFPIYLRTKEDKSLGLDEIAGVFEKGWLTLSLNNKKQPFYIPAGIPVILSATDLSADSIMDMYEQAADNFFSFLKKILTPKDYLISDTLLTQVRDILQGTITADNLNLTKDVLNKYDPVKGSPLYYALANYMSFLNFAFVESSLDSGILKKIKAQLSLIQRKCADIQPPAHIPVSAQIHKIKNSFMLFFSNPRSIVPKSITPTGDKREQQTVAEELDFVENRKRLASFMRSLQEESKKSGIPIEDVPRGTTHIRHEEEEVPRKYKIADIRRETKNRKLSARERSRGNASGRKSTRRKLFSLGRLKRDQNEKKESKKSQIKKMEEIQKPSTTKQEPEEVKGQLADHSLAQTKGESLRHPDQQKRETTKNVRKWKLLFITAGTVIVLGLVGYFLLSNGRFAGSADAMPEPINSGEDVTQKPEDVDPTEKEPAVAAADEQKIEPTKATEQAEVAVETEELDSAVATDSRVDSVQAEKAGSEVEEELTADEVVSVRPEEGLPVEDAGQEEGRRGWEAVIEGKRPSEEAVPNEEVRNGSEGVESPIEETPADMATTPPVRLPELEKGSDRENEQDETAVIGRVEPQIEEFTVQDILITRDDILEAANDIARLSGFREIDVYEQLGKDPHWIDPGEIFTLPDGSRYTVASGDTIWDIASDFIRKSVLKDLKNIDVLVSPPIVNKQDILEELRYILDRTYSENLRQRIEFEIREVENFGG